MLSFKDLKENYPLFILDKQDMSLTQGKVVSVTPPHYDVKAGQPSMVVEIEVEANGRTRPYVIPENLSVTWSGSSVLATEKEGLIRDIEAIKSTSEQVLASVGYHQGVVEKSSELLKELNPAFREREESEKRFKAIEGSVAEMGAEVSDMKKMLTDFIKEFKG